MSRKRTLLTSNSDLVAKWRTLESVFYRTMENRFGRADGNVDGTYFSLLPREIMFELIVHRFFDQLCRVCNTLKPRTDPAKVLGTAYGNCGWTRGYGYDVLCPRCYRVLLIAVENRTAQSLAERIAVHQLTDHARRMDVLRAINDRRAKWNKVLKRKKKNPRSYTTLQPLDLLTRKWLMHAVGNK